MSDRSADESTHITVGERMRDLAQAVFPAGHPELLFSEWYTSNKSRLQEAIAELGIEPPEPGPKLFNRIREAVLPHFEVEAKLRGRIEYLWETDESEADCYFIRGHVPAAALQRVVEREYGTRYDMAQIHQGYFRNVPCSIDGMAVCRAEGPGRGAYPVTFIDVLAR